MSDSAPLPSGPPSRSNATAAAVLVAAVVLAGGVFMGWQYFERRTLEENERMAPAALKTLSAANADFRSNDRDGNGINDFWTGDVAGLYSLGAPVGPGRSESIRLIPPEIARADAAHPGAVPHHGYFFVAMQTDENGIPYRQVTGPRPGIKPERNLSKFAFCAYPAEYGRTGRFTFIIDEGNRRFKIDTAGKPVLKWPTDDELKAKNSG
jgi:hypothetical protein